MNPHVLQVDVRKIVAQKNPNLAKYLPGFFWRWLKRTVQEDELNTVLRLSAGQNDLAFCQFLLKHFNSTVTSVGLERLGSLDRPVVASNHPLGGFDGIALMAEVGKVRPDFKFVINDLLNNIPNFKNVFVGVNKLGKNSRQSLIAVDNAFASDEVILIFPAGLCSRKGPDGIVRDLTWNKSFINRAIRNNRPIVPAFFRGQNTSWFYNLSRWRKRLGIKFNIEMLYLPDEMVKQRNGHLHMIFGPPIDPAVFNKTRTHEQWAELMRQYVYTLEHNPDADFRTFVAQYP